MANNDIFSEEIGDGSETRHAVYKYVYQGNTIIYIGKTDYSIKQRVSDHAKDEKFKPYLKDTTIYYSETASTLDTCIWEKLLINKYKPILNVVDNYEDSKIVGISMSPRKWKRFEDFSTFSTNTKNKIWPRPKPVGMASYDYNDNDLIIQEAFEKYGFFIDDVSDEKLINMVSHYQEQNAEFAIIDPKIVHKLKEAAVGQHKHELEIVFYQDDKIIYQCAFPIWDSFCYNKGNGIIQIKYDVRKMNLFYRYLKYNLNNARVSIKIVNGRINTEKREIN